MTTIVPPRTVPPTKLTDYLLDASHPVGGPMAAFFRTFGFSTDRLDVMTATLVAHPDRDLVEEVSIGR